MKSNTLSIFKVGLTLSLLLLLVWQITHFQQDHPIRFSYSAQWLLWLIITLMLAPLNWVLESLRWKSSMPGGDAIDLPTAWRTIMSGFTLGLITPARLGDYIGRSIMMPSKSSEIIIATWIAGLCQNWMNVCGGLIGLTCLYYQISNQYIIPFILLGGFLLILISLLLFMDQWRKFLYQKLIGFVKNNLKFIVIPTEVTTQTLEYYKPKLFILSALRYILYVTQYYFIALAFGILAPVYLLFAIISTILLIQSLIPLPFIAGLLSRAQISILIWGFIQVEIDKALTVSFVIWMINIMLPALIGLKYVMALKPIQEIK